MKLIVNISLIFSVLLTGTNAQNLVPNYSFESFNTCKYTSSYPILDTTFSGKSVVNDWVNPNNGTPEFFTTCFEKPLLSIISSSFFSVPSNFIGYQYPKTGNSYMGVLATGIHSKIEDDREYIQTLLKRKLVRGKRYCAGFYTSLANMDSVVVQTTASVAACGNWGMMLTRDRPHNFIEIDEGPIILPVLPQVNVSPPLKDTANWVLIHQEIIAEGDEQWLTIGNFSPYRKSWLDTLQYGTFGVKSFYYIDDVFVIPMEDGGLLGPDTIVCSSSFPLQLKAFDGFSNYRWTQGATAQSIVIDRPGTYVVQADYEGGCLITDTIRVEVLPPPPLQLPTLTYCPADLPTSFTAPWYAGVTQYQWSDGISGPTRTITGPGQWQLQVFDKCGSVTDTLLVLVHKLPTVDIGDVHGLCVGGIVQPMTLTNKEFLDNYRWSTGDTTASIVIDQPGRYRLETVTPCGILADEALVTGCEVQLYLPNVFHPMAADPVNRVFRPQILHGEVLSLSVYDRWGNWLYEARGPEASWDGTARGRQCEAGVYVCRITYRAFNDQNVREINQSVTLIR